MVDSLFEVPDAPVKRAAEAEPVWAGWPRMVPFDDSGGADGDAFDDRVRVVHGDCRALLGTLPDGFADICITDPPYTARTHAGARTGGAEKGRGEKLVTFDSIELDELRSVFVEVGRVTRRWVIATVDYRHAVHLEEDPPAGLRVLRIGIWAKANSMPQLSGDRPGMGWEAIVFMHTDRARPVWAGGGRNSVFVAPLEAGPHPTTKPQKLLRELISLFAVEGGMVLDPFCGSGSTLVAARAMGRRGLGFELDPVWAGVARDRLAQEILF